MALDNVRFADQFSGSDIGAQINAAYANLPSSGAIIVMAKGDSLPTSSCRAGNHIFDNPHGRFGNPAVLLIHTSRGSVIYESAIPSPKALA